MLAKKFASLYYLLEDLLSPAKYGLRHACLYRMLFAMRVCAMLRFADGLPPAPAATGIMIGVFEPSSRCWWWLARCCVLKRGKWSLMCSFVRCVTSTSPRFCRKTWSSLPACCRIFSLGWTHPGSATWSLRRSAALHIFPHLSLLSTPFTPLCPPPPLTLPHLPQCLLAPSCLYM